MRFKSSKKLQPELVAAKDPSRPVLNTVHLNADKSEVWVTDSYMLARFPVELDEGDTSGPIPLDALKASRKPPLKSLPTSIRCNSHVEVRHAFGEDASDPFATMPREDGGYTFPNLAQLVPDNLADFEIGLDAKKLYDLARAMGDSRVRIRFTNGPADDEGNASPSNMRPFIVTPLGGTEDDANGLLMPIRIG